MKKSVLIAIACWAVSPAWAQEPAQPDAPAADAGTQLPRVGADTRAWLDLQTSAASQVPDVRPVPGEVADQVYQRYVNSFKFPIPEEFKRDKFVQQGGSGS